MFWYFVVKMPEHRLRLFRHAPTHRKVQNVYSSVQPFLLYWLWCISPGNTHTGKKILLLLSSNWSRKHHWPPPWDKHTHCEHCNFQMHPLITYSKQLGYFKQMLYCMSRFQNCYKAKAAWWSSVSADTEYLLQRYCEDDIRGKMAQILSPWN